MKRSRHFFAMLSRMKYISRWGLMRNTRSENLSEHSLETAVLAHGLAVIRNRRFGGKVDPQRAATLALFHDVPEILTGDLPTPVKYFNPKIREAYHTVEEEASRRLLSCLPADLAPDMRICFFTVLGKKNCGVLSRRRISSPLSSSASKRKRQETGSLRKHPVPCAGLSTRWTCRRYAVFWRSSCPPIRSLWTEQDE